MTQDAPKNLFPRSSGVLLHPTSLPGRFGMGDLGEYAYRFVDWLKAAHQTIWQVLPLGPTGYADSPYQTLSAFAGNPSLISLDKLVDDGWLTAEDCADVPNFPWHMVDYGPVIDYHIQKLHLAYEHFAKAANSQKAAYEAWCAANQDWLEDWALFIALKGEYKNAPWVTWKEGLALREPAALAAARARLAAVIDEHRFLQWVFDRQWSELRAYANASGIRLVGDLPIFVAHDSCDVWANPGGFYLDAKGYPTIVAGVPPDYFSATGQRWGNPLYQWDKMEKDGYAWWMKRLNAMLKQVDLLRIDHFRGFEAYWEIPGSEETAVKGRWVKGPGAKFFTALRAALGSDLPIIAEDLGEITTQVVDLRDSFNLPGMKVLQFAWSEPNNPFLPHNHVQNSVVYSGTHDNNTTVGWWLDPREVHEDMRRFILNYLDLAVIYEVNWAMIKVGMRSVANTFIMPMQDVIGLGAEARMNTPGRETGNWSWRVLPEQLNDNGIRDRLAHLTWLYQRSPDQPGTRYKDAAELEAETENK